MREEMIKRGARTYFYKYLVYSGIIALLAVSCTSNSFEGKIVAVELADLSSHEGAKLIAIDPDKPGKTGRVLSKDFASASAPSLSHEGRYLYFQGKKNGGGPWQIWVLDLQKNSVKRVTDLPEDCFHPASLPDGTVIFSRTHPNNGGQENSLYRCKMNGSELTRITFNPGSVLHPGVLNEGRVLYLSQQQHAESGKPKIMIMRPDGTKSELYHTGYMGQQPLTGGVESEDGFIYFIEEGGSLARVNHNRPLHTHENLSNDLTGGFAAVYPYQNSGLLVSYRPEESANFGLYEFDAETQETPVLLYEGEKDVTDPVWIRALAERPKILPSAVNMEKSTGLLMSQNINHSMLAVHSDLKGDSMANRIRVVGLDGVIGELEVEEDGSFYLVLDADIPVRIETLNKQGETVRGPSDWIYLRPNERRGCVGCHADNELAPDNTQPMAVKGAPVDLSTKKENTSN